MSWDLAKDEIRARVDLLEVFAEAGHRFEYGKKCCCPFHQERTGSFEVYADGHYHCYGCGAHGDLFDAVMAFKGVDFPEAVRLLADRCGVELPRNPEEAAAAAARRTRQRGIFQVLTLAEKWYRKHLEEAPVQAVLDYCAGRGLTPELREKWGIGYAPADFQNIQTAAGKVGIDQAQLQAAGILGRTDAGVFYPRFRDRLMFAIRDHQGRTVGFSGRILDTESDKAKYVNTPETDVFHKGELLFGFDQAAPAIRKDGRAVLVEGQIDTIACHAAGVITAVAPQGTAFTAAQVERLTKFASMVILAMDQDEAGQTATERALLMLLDAEVTCQVSDLPADPGSYLQAGTLPQLAAALDHGRPGLEWLLDRYLTWSDAATALRDWLPNLQKVESELELSALLEYAAGKTEVKLSDLRRELRRLGKKDKRSSTSKENGAKGGRPRTDYSVIAYEFIAAHQVVDQFEFRWYRAWRRYRANAWREATREDMEAMTAAWLQEHHSDLSEAIALRNVMLNLRTANTGWVPSHLETPVWLDGQFTRAAGWLPMANGLLNVTEACRRFDGDELLLDLENDRDVWRLPTPALFSLHGMDYVFDPGAQCPLWERFLEVVQPNAEDRRVIQMLCGLLLVPETRFNVFVLLTGAAGTGKSTFLHVLEALIGRANVCTVPLQKFEDEHYSYLLTENLLNSVDDMGDVGSMKNIEGILKIATDGRPLDIRRLYTDGTKAPVIARTVAACNTLPVFYDRSEAIWDRLRIIPFNTIVRGRADQDSQLRVRIVKDELPGIFRWALQGLGRLQDLEVFPEHSGGLAAKDKHKGMCDPEGSYLRENYALHADCHLESMEVYRDYVKWSEENGYRTISHGKLNKAVERVFGLEKKLYRHQGSRYNGFVGLRRVYAGEETAPVLDLDATTAQSMVTPKPELEELGF